LQENVTQFDQIKDAVTRESVEFDVPGKFGFDLNGRNRLGLQIGKESKLFEEVLNLGAKGGDAVQNRRFFFQFDDFLFVFFFVVVEVGHGKIHNLKGVVHTHKHQFEERMIHLGKLPQFVKEDGKGIVFRDGQFIFQGIKIVAAVEGDLEKGCEESIQFSHGN